MELTVVPMVKPKAANFIFGQSHFIKTVEDLREALVGAVPGIRFGLAFCEASGKGPMRNYRCVLSSGHRSLRRACCLSFLMRWR
jgi:adenosine/AMP kinase